MKNYYITFKYPSEMYAAFGRIKHGTSSILVWAEAHRSYYNFESSYV